jgi:hypothetical protein
MPLTTQALLAAVGRRQFVPFRLMMQVGQPIEVGPPGPGPGGPVLVRRGPRRRP